MQSFKQYLTENTEIKNIINDYNENTKKLGYIGFPNSSIKNNKVYTKYPLELSRGLLDDNLELKIPLEQTAEIQITCTINSFKNFPEKIVHNGKYRNKVYNWALRSYYHQPKVTSLEGFPQYIDGNVDIAAFTELNYSKVYNYIKEITGFIIINAKYEGPMLGFLKIKGLQSISYDFVYSKKFNSYVEVSKSRFKQAIDIVNKYLKTDRDILGCQDELIENGLSEYAKL
jgi:hypothetical protein